MKGLPEKTVDAATVDFDVELAIPEKTKADLPATYETAIIACGYGRFHYVLMLFLIPLCCSQLFVSGAISFILPVAECDLRLDGAQKGLLNAACYIGNLMSGLVWGGVSDLYGRSRIVTACFMADFVVSLTCSFSTSFVMMLTLKVLSGIIISGPNAVVYAYIAETHDDKHRGLAIMMSGMAFAFSQIILPVLAYLLLPLSFRLPLIPGVMDLTPWRVFLIVCSVPSLVSFLCFLTLPESPKFLMSQGRHDEALRVFQRIYARNTGLPKESYPVKALDIAKVQKAAAERNPKEGTLLKAYHQFRPLFRKPYVHRIVMVLAIQLCIMLCINSIRMWTPQLFALIGSYEYTDWPSKPLASTTCQMISAVLERDGASLAGSDQSSAPTECAPIVGDVFLRSVVIGCVGTTSFLVSGWASKRFGDRPLLLSSLPMAAVASVAMLWASSSDMFMGLLAAFNPMTAIALTAMSAVNVNLFPTSLRGLTVSLSLFFGRMGSLLGNLIVPILLSLSCETLFIYLSVGLGFCSIIVWFLPRRGDDEED